MYRLILPALLVFACGSPAAAQLHKHFVAFKCEGQPDKVHSRRDERYFGCVNGRVACSDDGVSSSMIAAYGNRRANMKSESNRRMRELDAKHAASHGSTTGSTARRTVEVAAEVPGDRAHARPPHPQPFSPSRARRGLRRRPNPLNRTRFVKSRSERRPTTWSRCWASPSGGLPAAARNGLTVLPQADPRNWCLRTEKSRASSFPDSEQHHLRP